MGRPRRSRWSTLGFLPGLAGFIVWELKENWRLFEANRPRNLRPVMIGHHGETMRRLLLPGFHSGTIPKLFAKLRRAERQAYRTGEHEQARKAREAIHHVEDPIRHFVERGFAAILVRERPLRLGGDFALDRVELATNRVEVHAGLGAAGDRSLRITFEDEDGRLIARVCDGGFRSALTDEQRAALDAAIAGPVRAGRGRGLLGDSAGRWLPPAADRACAPAGRCRPRTACWRFRGVAGSSSGANRSWTRGIASRSRGCGAKSRRS